MAAGRDQVRGNLIITVADYFAQGRSETRYFVKDELRPGRIFEVHFTTEPSGATTGTSVAAQGRISGTLLEDAEIISPTRSPGNENRPSDDHVCAGLDANLPPAFTGGASIDFWAGGTGKTQLATYYPWSGALSDGQSYVSPYSPAGSLTITQLAHTSTNVTIEIRLGRRFPVRR